MMAPGRALAGHRGSFDLQHHSVLEGTKIQSPPVDRSAGSLVESERILRGSPGSLFAALCLISPLQEEESAGTRRCRHPAQPGVVIL